MAALLLMGLTAAASASYPDCMKYTVSTTDDYVVCWDMKAAKDPQATKLQFRLQVKTLGWIGFGIPEQSVGGMAGADILAVEYTAGEAVARDYYTVGEVFPTLDTCSQDWELLRSSQDNGMTTVEVARAFDMQAAHEDRSIPRGDVPMKLILAYGNSPTMAYHGAVRRPAGISFVGDVEPALPADAYNVKLMMKNYTVQKQRTTYACQAFDMTDYADIYPTQWAVRFEMLDTAKPRGAKHIVHHAGLYSCRYQSDQWKKYTTPGQCGTDAGVECGEVVFAWALGMGPLSMPLEAGFKVDHWVNRFLIMEIHYDNPEGVVEVDDSGVLMTLSPTARQHEAGVMHLGDPFVGLDGRVIPAGAPYTVQTECRSECTKTMPTPVTIFASHLHMHNIGTRIRITQVRDGKLITTIDSIDYWDFDFQGTNRVDHIKLLPGDELHTTCEWKNTRSTDAYFGLATEEEMCMGYLYTYPAHISYCGWYNESVYATACGRNSTPQAYVVTDTEVRDPTVLTDPPVPVVFGRPGTCPAIPSPTLATPAPPTVTPPTPVSVPSAAPASTPSPLSPPSPPPSTPSPTSDSANVTVTLAVDTPAPLSGAGPDDDDGSLLWLWVLIPSLLAVGVAVIIVYVMKGAGKGATSFSDPHKNDSDLLDGTEMTNNK